MRGSSLSVDGCFQLLDPLGAVIAEDCDDGGIVQVTNVVLDATGNYTIEARDHNDNDTGDYGLSLEVLNGNEGTEMVSCSQDIMASFDDWCEVHMYGMEAEAGDHIMVQMRSVESNIECQLEVIDPSGNVLDSEFTQSGLAIISNFVAPSSGTYKIAAFDENGNDIGAYGISFQTLTQSACTEIAEAGVTYTKTFQQIAQIDAYSVTCKAGDQLTIQMNEESNGLEPSLIFCDEEGQVLASVIDEQTATMDVTIPSDGTYNLIVREDKGNDVGDYTLLVELTNTNFDEFTILDCGNTSLNATLETNDERDIYAFEAQEGELINIQMRGYDNGIDPLVKLINNAGTILIEESAIGNMAGIKDFKIPAHDRYYISVEDVNNNDSGDYGFSFQKVNIDVCASDLGCHTEFTTKSIDNYAEMDLYEFTADANQMISFIMEEVNPDLEPMVRFYAPDGELLIEDAKAFHVDITEYILPQSGRYTIVCSDNFGNDTGEYSIGFKLYDSIGDSACETCDDGIQNGLETGIDCGGPDCGDCCPEAGLACDDGDPNTTNDLTDGNCGCAGEICPSLHPTFEVCPRDIALNCSDISGTNSSATPISITGAGTYDMTIKFTADIEENGVCEINSATFDSGCIGIITACWGNTLKLTPDYPTCLGPLPQLPFTITFNGDTEVFFDESGAATVVSGGNSIADHPVVADWLKEYVIMEDHGIDDYQHDFDHTIFNTICDSENAGQSVTQVVNFSWKDFCDNELSCQASITITNDQQPIQGRSLINVYPNPSVQEINLGVSSFAGEDVTVRITNVYGLIVYQEVYKNIIASDLNIDLDRLGLNEGMYNVIVSSSRKKYDSKTFFKASLK